MKYMPDLTAKVRRALLRDIANFDEKKTRELIEREAVGGNDIDAYNDWRNEHGYEPPEANPDVLREDQAVNFNRPALSNDIVQAKKVIDELLSFRERQVWNLVMRQGYTKEKAAELLHLKVKSVDTYLTRAKVKVHKGLNHAG